MYLTLKALVKVPQHIFRTHKIRPTFYIENTLCKLLCKPKEACLKKIKAASFMKMIAVAVNIVYFSESKQ